MSNTLDSEDADGSISCYGCETGLDRVTSKAVAATLLAHGEATIDLLQYVLFSVRTSEWMWYKEDCYCDVSFICASWSSGVIAGACFEH